MNNGLSVKLDLKVDEINKNCLKLMPKTVNSNSQQLVLGDGSGQVSLYNNTKQQWNTSVWESQEAKKSRSSKSSYSYEDRGVKSVEICSYKKFKNDRIFYTNGSKAYCVNKSNEVKLSLRHLYENQLGYIQKAYTTDSSVIALNSFSQLMRIGFKSKLCWNLSEKHKYVTQATSYNGSLYHDFVYNPTSDTVVGITQNKAQLLDSKLKCLGEIKAEQNFDQIKLFNINKNKFQAFRVLQNNSNGSGVIAQQQSNSNIDNTNNNNNNNQSCQKVDYPHVSFLANTHGKQIVHGTFIIDNSPQVEQIIDLQEQSTCFGYGDVMRNGSKILISSFHGGYECLKENENHQFESLYAEGDSMLTGVLNNIEQGDFVLFNNIYSEFIVSTTKGQILSIQPYFLKKNTLQSAGLQQKQTLNNPRIKKYSALEASSNNHQNILQNLHQKNLSVQSQMKTSQIKQIQEQSNSLVSASFLAVKSPSKNNLQIISDKIMEVLKSPRMNISQQTSLKEPQKFLNRPPTPSFPRYAATNEKIDSLKQQKINQEQPSILQKLSQQQNINQNTATIISKKCILRHVSKNSNLIKPNNQNLNPFLKQEEVVHQIEKKDPIDTINIENKIQQLSNDKIETYKSPRLFSGKSDLSSKITELLCRRNSNQQSSRSPVQNSPKLTSEENEKEPEKGFDKKWNNSPISLNKRKDEHYVDSINEDSEIQAIQSNDNNESCKVEKLDESSIQCEDDPFEIKSKYERAFDNALKASLSVNKPSGSSQIRSSNSLRQGNSGNRRRLVSDFYKSDKKNNNNNMSLGSFYENDNHQDDFNHYSNNGSFPAIGTAGTANNFKQNSIQSEYQISNGYYPKQLVQKKENITFQDLYTNKDLRNDKKQEEQHEKVIQKNHQLRDSLSGQSYMQSNRSSQQTKRVIADDSSSDDESMNIKQEELSTKNGGELNSHKFNLPSTEASSNQERCDSIVNTDNMVTNKSKNNHILKLKEFIQTKHQETSLAKIPSELESNASPESNVQQLNIQRKQGDSLSSNIYYQEDKMAKKETNPFLESEHKFILKKKFTNNLTQEKQQLQYYQKSETTLPAFKNNHRSYSHYTSSQQSNTKCEDNNQSEIQEIYLQD